MITTDKIVEFLHKEMEAMSNAIGAARSRGLQLESIEKEHDMYAAIKHFVVTHEDKNCIKTNPIHKGLITPFEGWRFICDEYGVMHHVPDMDLLKDMCCLYYGEEST